MKRVLLLLFILLAKGAVGQSTDKNFVLSRTYKQSGASASDVSQVQISIEYLDGLGRSLQTVKVGQSPSGADVVVPRSYDAYGRETHQYLPYTVSGGNGVFQGGALSNQLGFYSGNVPGLESTDLARPYTETGFEASPLNRPTTIRASGEKSATASIVYGVNTGSEVKRYDFSANASWVQTLVTSTHYAVGTLTKVRTTDENGKVSEEFKDVEGRVICRKAFSPTEQATYYVYDDYGQLRGVIQPQHEEAANLAELTFFYEYDDKGRVIRKKVPGAGDVLLAYDRFDRLALSQDAEQAKRGVWSFHKYDALNRVVMMGEIPSGFSRSTWQGMLDVSTAHHENPTGSGIGYTLSETLPSVTESQLRTVTYYSYGFDRPAYLNYAGTGSPVMTSKTLVTGTRTRMIDGDWLVSVTYYDGEKRPIQTNRQLFDLGTDAMERVSFFYKYNLASVMAEEVQEQVTSTGTITHSKTFQYDHADRLLSVQERITKGTEVKEAVTLAQRYNELGEVKQQWYHSRDGLYFRRRTDVSYNIRGWQTQGHTVYKRRQSEADSVFYGYELAYLNGTVYTNGNISQLLWKGKNEGSYSRGLSFSYDGVNRLTGSSGLGGYGDIENGITYDRNGNIKTLNRSGSAVDQLVYGYHGNQLTKLTDYSGNALGTQSGSYLYDDNGNMTSDGPRGAIITYNYLNLPQRVTRAGQTYNYSYDARGNKHRYTAPGGVTKYAGGFEYAETNGLKRVWLASGQAVVSDSVRFQYYLKDHLGNVRLVFDEKGTILQQTDYYPFGLDIARQPGTNSYLYNGKEKQEGSGYLDYGARMYMPEIGRWGVVDPLAEKFSPVSAFIYALNNPYSFIDPDGRDVYEINGGVQYTGDDAVSAFRTIQNSSGGGDPPGKRLNAPAAKLTTATDNPNASRPIQPRLAEASNERQPDVLRAKEYGYWFTKEEKAAHQGIYEGASIIAGDKVFVAGSGIIGLFRNKATKTVLNPNQIHFMQSSIKNTTGEFTVLGNAEALANGSLDPNVLRMNVWKDSNGKIWTLDHRRLAAFRLSGLQEAPIQWANPAGQMWKMTTTNGGTSIKLKLGGGQSMIVN